MTITFCTKRKIGVKEGIRLAGELGAKNIVLVSYICSKKDGEGFDLIEYDALECTYIGDIDKIVDCFKKASKLPEWIYRNDESQESWMNPLNEF